MSGLVGCFNRGGKPVDASLIERMNAVLAHRGPDGAYHWVHQAMGLGFQALNHTPESVGEQQPLVVPNTYALVFDGRLDNRSELLQALPHTSEINDRSSDAQLVLAAYAHWGEALPEKLNGDYAFALFDLKQQKLLLVRDAIGVRPLYYAQVGETLLFGSEIKALLECGGLKREPNDDLLAELLLVHVYSDRQTVFKNIYAVAPGHILIADRGGVRERRYWDFDPNLKIRYDTFQEYAAAFREYFERALIRRLRSAYPVGFTVSGGMDSSSLFCLAQQLKNQGKLDCPDILGFSKTFEAGTPMDELKYLEAIEAQYGMRVQRMSGEEVSFVRDAREAVWHLEVPYIEERWTSVRKQHITIREGGARSYLSGHWGDEVLTALGYMVDLVRSLRFKEVCTHIKEIPSWIEDLDPSYFHSQIKKLIIKTHLPRPFFHLLRGYYYKKKRDKPYYARAFRERLWRNQWKRPPVGAHIKSLHARSVYEQVRSSFRVLCMEWDNKAAALDGLDFALPFTDRDLIQFLMAIPGEYYLYQGRLKALLRESMRGVVPQIILERRTKADFSQAVSRGAQSEYELLYATLLQERRVLDKGYLDPQCFASELRLLRDRLGGNNAEASWQLTGILGLEQWLAVFMENGTIN